jgi:hypothetical protein
MDWGWRRAFAPGQAYSLIICVHVHTCVLFLKFLMEHAKEQMQVLRLTTPKLKNVRGPDSLRMTASVLLWILGTGHSLRGKHIHL